MRQLYDNEMPIIAGGSKWTKIRDNIVMKIENTIADIGEKVDKEVARSAFRGIDLLYEKIPKKSGD